MHEHLVSFYNIFKQQKLLFLQLLLSKVSPGAGRWVQKQEV